jgi:hypothetical protein
MSRLLSMILLLLTATSASAIDRFAPDPEPVSIATTARILRIDVKNKILKVRGGDSQSFHYVPQMVQNLGQRIGLTFPSRFPIGLPGVGGKHPQKPADGDVNSLDEYTVVIRSDTVIQDGAEPIRLEDFKVGEIISIHGVLRGSTLTASRIAKWF